MKNFDHLALDGHSLRLFLTVLEEGSVTVAAERLELTQSAVSHQLQKMRRIVGDPLFVKAGRGIVATAHAEALAPRARDLMDALAAFATPPELDLASARLRFAIAANDFQAELLLPETFRRLSAVAGAVELSILPSGSPNPELLREGHADLVLSPYPPSGLDILQRKLFQERIVCFYDASCREAPRTTADYLYERHVTVLHNGHDKLEFDKRLEEAGVERSIVVSVSGFAGVPSFLRGTTMLASLPSLLGQSVMSAFGMARIPDEIDVGSITALPMFMAWHRRHQLDPAHVFLRETVQDVAMSFRHRLE